MGGIKPVTIKCIDSDEDNQRAAVYRTGRVSIAECL